MLRLVGLVIVGMSFTYGALVLLSSIGVVVPHF